MLAIKEVFHAEYVTLQLSGEIDASNSVLLDEAIKQAINGKHQKILIDATGLTYISSAGLGVFMSYLEVFEEKNIYFALYGLSPAVFQVFQILGLDQLLTITGSAEEALQTS
ncbi:MAG: STAS domain-containing protein [Nitritalea sp.]